MPYPEPYPDNFRCLIRTPYPASRPAGRLAGRLWGPRGQPRAPSWVRAPSLENFHQKTVTRKSTSRGTVWGSFWPKLVKSRAFKPNGRHEQFRSALFIGKSSVGCSKALTRTPFVTNREVDFPALSGLIRAPYVDKPWPDFWTRRWATSRNAAPLEPKPYPALSAGDRCRKGSYPALSVFFCAVFFFQ